MSIRLSARLRAIADKVPPGARVIDVGTDHAMLPVWLAQTGRAVHIWAADIRPGPLQSAAALIAETGVGDRVETRLTDGLAGFTPEDADTIVIAGMGGETMTGILRAAEWVRERCLLVLSPQSKQEVLRTFLIHNGYAILTESLVEDAGRIYPILTVRGGAGRSGYTEAELRIGAFEQISGDPLFDIYLRMLVRRAERAAPFDDAAGALLAEYRIMEERKRNYADSR